MGNVMEQRKWTGKLIKAERLKLQISQAELAHRLGCRQQTISEWELGMYAPKNAYQRILSIVLGEAPVVE